MEIAGLTISVAGLATLFDMCLRGFDLLEQGKDSSRDHTILTARLNAQRANFAIWGEAVGLSASRDSNNNIFPFNSELRSVVKGHLDCISLIFEDATQLSKKYGVMPTPNNGHQTSTQESLRSYLSWFQKQTSHRKKAKWVIRDLAKFRGMLDDLSRLITDLREITSSLADIKRQREVFFAEEIAQRTDMEDLEVIEEALSQEDPTLSSAASERRTILTQTAFTNLSELNPFKNRDEDDDMHTHADSDPGAQFSDVNDTSTDHKTDVQFDDDEKSLEISAMYGHQNNLSEIQKNDEIAIARSYPFWRADSSRLARRYTLMQLKHFHDHQSETQFISIGFADNVEGTDQLVNLYLHDTLRLLILPAISGRKVSGTSKSSESADPFISELNCRTAQHSIRRGCICCFAHDS